MHNAAFEALGLDWVYVAFPVPRGHGEHAVRAVTTLGLAGLNVTMPHKDAAAAACDELDTDSSALGAVNTVIRDGEALRGASTDGAGFLAALADEDIDARAQRALVLGAGGAGRAIARALGGAGAGVTVAARRVDAATAAAALGGGTGIALAEADVAGFDVIVNATPLGMHGEPAPVDLEGLHPGQFVFDTVYPAETPLLAAARAGGVPCAGGLGMLVHQGARSFELWTGRPAPLDVMRRAAETA
jgi:shikimate dehydrogenase